MVAAFTAAAIALAGVALGALIDLLRDLRHRRWALEDARREQRRAKVEELIMEVDRVKAALLVLGMELLNHAASGTPLVDPPERERFQAAKVGMFVAVYAPSVQQQMDGYRAAATGLGSAITALIRNPSDDAIAALGAALLLFEGACNNLINAAVAVAGQNI